MIAASAPSGDAVCQGSTATANPDNVRLPLRARPQGDAEVEADNFQTDVSRLCALLEDEDET